MSWFEQSIMARNAVAKGKPGAKHAITEAVQGKYHYTYGPFAKPVLTVDPGAVVSCETHDAFEGAIKLATDKPSEKLNFPFLNPQNGPIFVNGAEKGDCLAVYIKSIVPRGPQPVGTTALIPEFGGLVGTTATALLNKPLPEYVKKIEVTVEGGVKWSDKITLPYEPFIGTIGTAPEIEAISSLVPDYYGGNMDLPDVAPDSVIYLPVNAPGALLYLGDCHAIQGDGELCGVALEHPTVTTVQVDLIKGWTIAWPRLETSEFYMTIGSARPMEDASRIAYRELIRWMEAEFGFDETDAYLLLTMCGKDAARQHGRSEIYAGGFDREVDRGGASVMSAAKEPATAIDVVEMTVERAQAGFVSGAFTSEGLTQGLSRSHRCLQPALQRDRLHEPQRARRREVERRPPRVGQKPWAPRRRAGCRQGRHGHGRIPDDRRLAASAQQDGRRRSLSGYGRAGRGSDAGGRRSDPREDQYSGFERDRQPRQRQLGGPHLQRSRARVPARRIERRNGDGGRGEPSGVGTCRGDRRVDPEPGFRAGPGRHQADLRTRAERRRAAAFKPARRGRPDWPVRARRGAGA